MVMTTKRRGVSNTVDGILLLDKPFGRRSNQVLQTVKRLFKAGKAGHTGSLDRIATGLLPLCFGQATKLSGFLLNADKRYHAVCHLGVVTTTGDIDGKILEQTPVDHYSTSELEQILSEFIGEIEQLPPMYSAVHYKGQRLYKLAYQDITVERPPRTVVIHDVRLIDHTSDSLSIEVYCSKGVYIRTLVEDIGRRLGCGAHVKVLRRLGSGPFTEDQMVTMDRLEEAAAGHGHPALAKYLLPMDEIVQDLDAVYLPEDSLYCLCQGQAVQVPQAPSQGLLRVYDQQKKIWAIGEAKDEGWITVRRLLVNR